jgi:ubiquitin-activating enzyme E1
MGREAQRRMANSAVLIYGLNGLGVEVAKNVILAGVKSVTLHDETPTAWSDLAAQFYLSESDLGQPRAAACASKLAELNRYVKVRTYHMRCTACLLIPLVNH